MKDSLADQFRRDMECEGLLPCLHGLRDLDVECFEALVAADEPLTVDDIARTVDCERSTAYRSVQRLLQHGFLEKEQVNYDQGGYYHVYRPTDPAEITDEMQRLLNDWYAKMGQLIQEFETKYEERDSTPPPASH